MQSAGQLSAGRSEDHDGDGIVDRLDILIGAKKLLINQARYLDRYVVWDYVERRRSIVG